MQVAPWLVTTNDPFAHRSAVSAAARTASIQLLLVHQPHVQDSNPVPPAKAAITTPGNCQQRIMVATLPSCCDFIAPACLPAPAMRMNACRRRLMVLAVSVPVPASMAAAVGAGPWFGCFRCFSRTCRTALNSFDSTCWQTPHKNRPAVGQGRVQRDVPCADCQLWGP